MTTFEVMYRDYVKKNNNIIPYGTINKHLTFDNLTDLVKFISTESFSSVVYNEKLGKIYISGEDIFTFFHKNMVDGYQFPNTYKGEIEYDDSTDFINSMALIMIGLLEHNYDNKEMIKNILDNNFISDNVYAQIFHKVQVNMIQFAQLRYN